MGISHTAKHPGFWHLLLSFSFCAHCRHSWRCIAGAWFANGAFSKITFKWSWLGFDHNSLFPAHQSQTKYFRKTFRQMFLWPHQLQKKKTNDKKSNLCCMKNVNGWTDANMKTVRANFLSRLHRTWVWWTLPPLQYSVPQDRTLSSEPEIEVAGQHRQGASSSG